jgi:hypothetical protein
MTIYAVRVAVNEFAADTEIRALFDTEEAAGRAIDLMEELRLKYPNASYHPSATEFAEMKYDMKKMGLSPVFHPYDLIYSVWEIAPMMVHTMPTEA